MHGRKWGRLGDFMCAGRVGEREEGREEAEGKEGGREGGEREPA